jgi:hypothetical protein
MTVIPAPPRAYTGPALVRIIVLAGVVPVLVAVAAALLMLLWAPELPDPVAIHWGATGQVDGYGSLISLVIMVPALVLAISAAVTLALGFLAATTYEARQPQLLVATSVFLSVFLSVGIGGSVYIQRGLAAAAEAGSVFAPLGLGLVLGLGAGAGAWFAAPRPAVFDDGEAEETRDPLALSAVERVSWSRTIRPSAGLLWCFIAIFVVAIVVSSFAAVAVSSAALWIPIAILGVALAASIVCFFWRVTIGNRGVTIRSAGGLFRRTIALADITAVRVVRISPFADFGGWGLRVGPGRIGYVVRSGEALEIVLGPARSVVVTVDDADAAATVLEGLLSRRDGA